MAAKIGFHHEIRKQSESQAAYGEDFRLQELESRLERLLDQLESFQADTEVVGSRSGPPRFDWRGKVDAIRWMLRVAKHTERPGRERILITVENTLDQLDKVVEHTSHAA